MFQSSNNLFKKWIDKWIKLKIQAEKDENFALRTICKLMLNNLYGKFATNPQVGSKYPILNNNVVQYKNIQYDLYDKNNNPVLNENGEVRTTTKALRESIYIPVGTFVTAYSREKTIRTSQKIHIDSIIKTGHSRYLYSDTDSIHIMGFKNPENIDIVTF